MRKRFLHSVLFLAVLCFGVEGSFAQPSEFKIIASDGEKADQFGVSVSLSGDRAIVGAFFDDDDGLRSGSAYIFRRDVTGWVEEIKLSASDAGPNRQFGYSVSLNGDRAIVGARLDNGNAALSGSAYIFRRDVTGWVEEAKLTASDGASVDRFGESVSLSGDRAIVGANIDDNDNGADAGGAYIFKRTGTVWAEEAKLTASDEAEDDQFGVSVSLSGDRAVVGAIEDDNDNGADAGAAYIFKRTGTVWVEEIKLTASDGAAVDAFGESVSKSGDQIIVGAGQDDAGRLNSGSAYIFSFSGGSWVEDVKLTPSVPGFGAFFGESVFLSGGEAIVGAVGDRTNGASSGAAYIFTLDAPPETPNEPPVADAGPDQTGVNAVDCTSPDGADVTLDGTGSSDPDEDALSFSWSASGITFDDSTSAEPTATFPLGTTTVTLIVTDPGGLSDTDEVDIRVEDNTPPVVTVSASPTSLWPPNHKYEVITLLVSANDDCDPSVAVSATAVSNEPDDANGNGDGKTTGDIKVTTAGGGVLLSSNAVPEVTFDPMNDQLELRAERGGNSDGRIYTITVTATDASGNSTPNSAQVTVAHDKGKGAAKPIAGGGTVNTDLVLGSDLGLFVGPLAGRFRLESAKNLAFELHQNYPNPFNPATTIQYTLTEGADVRLTIYNILGQQVRVLGDTAQGAGVHSVQWDGKDAFGRQVTSGLYLYRLEAGNNVAVRKMVLAK